MTMTVNSKWWMNRLPIHTFQFDWRGGGGEILTHHTQNHQTMGIVQHLLTAILLHVHSNWCDLIDFQATRPLQTHQSNEMSIWPLAQMNLTENMNTHASHGLVYELIVTCDRTATDGKSNSLWSIDWMIHAILTCVRHRSRHCGPASQSISVWEFIGGCTQWVYEIGKDFAVAVEHMELATAAT